MHAIARTARRPQARRAQSALLALSLLLTVAALPADAAASDAAQTLSAETMWSLQRLASPAISPDGSRAVVAVTRFDVKDNKGYTDLWLFPTAGGPGRPLTADDAADTSPSCRSAARTKRTRST